MNIMLVEDDDDIRELAQQFLEMEGHVVEAFSRAREALDHLIAGNLPRVIFLDWRMPVMSGKDFLEEYQRHDFKNKVPVYLFSAENDSRLFENTGAVGILTKPINFPALFTLLESLN